MELSASDRIAETRPLGSGGFGAVYAGTWDLDDREHAIKVVQAPIAAVQREFLALRPIDHPNIARCWHAAGVVAYEMLRGRSAAG